MITIRFFSKLRDHFDICTPKVEIGFKANISVLNALNSAEKVLGKSIVAHLVEDGAIQDGIILFVSGKKVSDASSLLEDGDELNFYTPPLGG